MTSRGTNAFFRYARARHQVYLNREAGMPRPWSKDRILDEFRFTNVFRELDKTTVWFRKHVRDPMRETEEVLLATVAFRMLNRISVGEAIWSQKDLEYESAWAEYVETGRLVALKRAILANCGRGPYVTGAYIISTPPGMKKLDGALWVIDNFRKKSNWREYASRMMSNECSLQATWSWFAEHDYLGSFHSYEIVTDLRHTTLLRDAPDIMTWASPGPGARRGLNRVHERDVGDHTSSRPAMIEDMRTLLEISKDARMWPRDWPVWEMREVEHTLCEFDKYERVRLGEGRPRGVYR